MDTEFLFCEIRHDPDENGRILRGTAMKYGSVAKMPWGEERFEPHAFGEISKADVILERVSTSDQNRLRELARTGLGGLTLTD